MRQKSLAVWVEGAIMIALATAMEFIPHYFFGFTIGFSMIPIVIYALRYGVFYGVTSGVIWGILDLVLLGQILNPYQAILEYPIACGSVGLAGLFSSALFKKIYKKRLKAFIITENAVALAVFSKFGIHFIAGIIFWRSYATPGMSPELYSLVINGISGLLTMLVVGVVLGFLILEYPNFFKKD